MYVFKQLALFGITALLTLLLLEVYLRLAEVEAVSISDFDPEVGRVMMPNRDFTYYNENFTVGSYNQYGYLGPAYPPQLPDGTLRLALLGDSYVEGFQVQPRNHFRTLLERQLRDTLSTDAVEVLNFGRSGFDLANSRAYDSLFVSKFRPDLTLYFLAVSDLEQSKDDPLLPHWYLEDEQLKLSDDFRRSGSLRTFQLVKHGLHHSSILQMLNNDLKLVKAGEASRILFEKVAALWSPEAPPVPKDTLPAVDEIALALIQDISRDPGSIIVNRDTIPFPPIAQQAIRQAGIPLISVADTLAPLRQQGLDAIAWEATGMRGHWNHIGHRAVAFYLADRLVPLIRQGNQQLTSQP
jgi:hypothetical protein